MERRKTTTKRRETHLFVADERRAGPHDRRGAGNRQGVREREQAKIERIRAFKAKDKVASQDTPLFSKKRLVYLGIALLVIFAVWYFID